MLQTPFEFYSAIEKALAPTVALTTWEKCYAPYLRKWCSLIGDCTPESLDAATIKVCGGYEEKSRSRQVAITCLSRAYSYLGLNIPVEVHCLSRPYGTSDVVVEPLPSDADIQSAWASIPSVAWKNAYALMATYGIRNHEIFRSELLDTSSGLKLKIEEETKTGTRVAFPYPAQWVTTFHIEPGMVLPSLARSSSNQRLGQQVSLQFKRYGIDFKPYALRRSFACRAIALGNDFIVAKSLGHSVRTLNEIYRKHIDPSRLEDMSNAVFAQSHIA